MLSKRYVIIEADISTWQNVPLYAYGPPAVVLVTQK